MKKILLLTAIAFSFVACDPMYHLRYAVLNDSGQTIYCVDGNRKGPDRIMRIEPDTFIQVYSEEGLGWGRRQFNDSRGEVTGRFRFYTDSSLADSTRIVPRKNWKYYPLPIGDYNARVYIRRKDVR